MSTLQKRKKWDWKARIRAEIDCAGVSRLYRFSFRPRGRLDFTSKNPEIEKICAKDLRDWYRRMHAKYGKFCYVAVGEFGDKGRFHFHVVIHDGPSSRAVRKEWRQGQTHVKNIEQGRIASYVAKYVGKDFANGKSLRVRASQGYGVRSQRWLADHALGQPIIAEIVRCFPAAAVSSPRLPAGPYFRDLCPRPVWCAATLRAECAAFGDLHPADRAEGRCDGFQLTQVALIEYRKKQRQLRARWHAHDLL